MDRAQLVIDFIMRNRRPIGGVIFIVGLGLRSVTTPCAWCHGVAEFALAAGAYIHGTGVNSSDKSERNKQAFRNTFGSE